MYKKIVVTGGAGMVGYAMVPAMSKIAEEVIVLDNFSRGSNKEWPNDLGNVVWFDQDVTKDSAEQFYEGADAVVNMAASVGGYQWNAANNYAQFMDNIALQTVPVKHALSQGVPTFVQFSSACVYSVCPNNSYPPFSENTKLRTTPYTVDEKGIPEIGYGNAKIMGELAVLHSHKMFGKSFQNRIVLRPDNIGGDMDYADDRGHVIPVLIRRMKKAFATGEPMVIHNPFAERSFVHATDVAALVFNILFGYESGPNHDGDKRVSYGLLNVGLENRISINRIAEVLNAKIFDNEVQLKRGDNDSMSFNRSVNTDRLRAMTEWNPRYDSSRRVVESYADYYTEGTILHLDD